MVNELVKVQHGISSRDKYGLRRCVFCASKAVVWLKGGEGERLFFCKEHAIEASKALATDVERLEILPVASTLRT